PTTSSCSRWPRPPRRCPGTTSDGRPRAFAVLGRRRPVRVRRVGGTTLRPGTARGSGGRPPGGQALRRTHPVVQTHQALASARDDLAAARELADDDASFADEAERLAAEAETLEAKLADLLAPRDPHDADDVLMEIKSGEGGEESALFASELARMYTRYAEKHGWVVQTLGATESDLGGVKDASLSIRARQPSRDGVWSRLKFEGGVHRVQRVPVTESQGRV